MDVQNIKERKNEVTAREGAWAIHSVHLGGEVYTTDEPSRDVRLRQIVQVVADITNRPLDALRIVDLACCEGIYGIEFALHGANVLNTEGREVNLAKVRFVKDMLGLDNLECALDDVRNLSQEKYGTFDAVLCLGILYHLDTPAAFEFVEKVADVCRRVAIIETHISLEAVESCLWKGKTYWGVYGAEHNPNSGPEERLKAVFDSLDNVRSFWLTHASLCNLLRQVGFTSVYQCHIPPHEWEDAGKQYVWRDRVTLVAIKGQRHKLLSSPITESTAEIVRQEQPEIWPVWPAPPEPKLKQTLKRHLHWRLRRLLRDLGT